MSIVFENLYVKSSFVNDFLRLFDSTSAGFLISTIVGILSRRILGIVDNISAFWFILWILILVILLESRNIVIALMRGFHSQDNLGRLSTLILLIVSIKFSSLEIDGLYKISAYLIMLLLVMFYQYWLLCNEEYITINCRSFILGGQWAYFPIDYKCNLPNGSYFLICNQYFFLLLRANDFEHVIDIVKKSPDISDALKKCDISYIHMNIKHNKIVSQLMYDKDGNKIESMRMNYDIKHHRKFKGFNKVHKKSLG